MRPLLTIAVALVLGVTACREPDGPIQSGNGSVYVTSDPPGARIFLDNSDTGRLTPDTIHNLSGTHDFSVQLDTFQAVYGYAARLFVGEPRLYRLDGPLVNRCADNLCLANPFRHYSVNRIRFANNPVGTLFLERGTGGNGLLWPSGTSNSYAAGSMVGFAGIVDGSDTVAIGVYDNSWLAGRPAPEVVQTADSLTVTQTTWILPAPNAINRPTVRGISVRQELLATAALDDVVLLRLTFRNVTADPLYRALDPIAAISGIVYEQAYVGFLLDPDIGAPGDDFMSYEQTQNLVFAYDSQFDEAGFGGGFNRAPGLIGLQLVEPPPSGFVMLNGWTSQGAGTDWVAGTTSEKLGWYMLSGLRVYQPDHPFRKIGYLPESVGDVRLSVSAGPYRFAPGDSVALTVAILLAEPVPATFTSGAPLEPGDPLDNTRPLHVVARNLFDRAALTTAIAASSRGGVGGTAVRRPPGR
jgi:hypothetical protein